MDFKIGFWNYVETGILDPKKAVKDWKELGMTLPMSFAYDPKKHKKEDMIALLDECHKEGMKVIVCDIRASYRTLCKIGVEAYEKGMREAVADFASHPAVFGFEVGDEPNKEQWQSAIDAYKINLKCAPHLTPFINMFPMWGEDDFELALGVPGEKYADLNADFMQKAGAKLISYDYYGQCAFFEREKWLDLYFKNLNIFKEAAERNNGQYFNSVLCVPHWAFREPTEDDIRWQISTSVAHGASGIMWFFIYERTLDGSYRRSPIDLFWNRTPLFDILSRQNRIYNEFYAKILKGYHFDKVWHYLKALGDTEEFVGNSELEGIKHIVNPVPTAVSRFINNEGKVAYILVNLSQTEPTKIQPNFTGTLAKYNEAFWYAPGQMIIFTEEKRMQLAKSKLRMQQKAEINKGAQWNEKRG